MAYTPFNPDRPDVAAVGATRLSEITHARNNLTALADMMAAFAAINTATASATAALTGLGQPT